MATDNGDILVCRVGILELRDETGSADNIKGGDTEQAFWVVDIFRLEDLGADRDGGIDLSVSTICKQFLCVDVRDSR